MEVSHPKVSVIIPCYNVQKYIRQCLDGVINQTLKDIEIICIDDGSTDFTFSILMECALNNNKIKIHKQRHKREKSAKNIGFKMSKGEYVYFLNTHYCLEKETLSKLYDATGNKLILKENFNLFSFCKKFFGINRLKGECK